MTCGCLGASQSPSGHEATRERAAICRACPDALYAGLEAVGCTVSGRPIEDHVAGAIPCPIDSFPGVGGVSRWLGVEWYGVAYPVRLWARLTARTRPRMDSWRGCGCLRRAKDWWVRLTA